MRKLPCSEGEAYGFGSQVPHLWQHRSKPPIHTACAGGFFSFVLDPPPPSPSVTPPAAKRDLRERLIRSRAALPPGDRASASASIAARVAALPAWASARTVALYHPLGAEVDTAELARRAREEGKRIAWPRLRPGQRGMDFAACDEADLVAGERGAREPPATAPSVAPGLLDVVVVPGVGFDHRCRRLGRGAGHYDATLAALSPALTVGLAFEAQLVAELPAEPHDVPLGTVVTERRTLRSPAGGAPHRRR